MTIPYRPDLPGSHDFVGEQYHTGQWPHEPVEFRGKRVAVIGTGASAVQLVPVIAAEVESLIVYERTPNWCAPLNNGPITPEEQQEIKRTHDEIYENCRRNFAGFLHRASKRYTFDDTKEERWALYEKLWNDKGFAKLFSNFRVKRRSDLSPESFHAYWRDVHGPLGARVPGVRRYVQHHAIPNLYAGGREPVYDGVAQTWFDDLETMRTAAGTEQLAVTLEDQPEFITSPSPFVVCTSIVMR